MFLEASMLHIKKVENYSLSVIMVNVTYCPVRYGTAIGLQSVPRIYINKASCLFLSQFWPILNRALFLEAAGAVLKIG